MTSSTPAPADDSARGAVVRGGATGPLAWLRLVVGTLCQAALATLVLFALWAALPALLGWQPTTVSSGSMMPRLHIGDVAVARPVGGAPALEQVLLFDDPDHPGRLRLHRFVRVDDRGRMVTRGDANQGEDSSTVDETAVRGVAVLRVPAVALPIVWLREGRWLELGLAAGALVLVLAGSRLSNGAGTGGSGPQDPGSAAGRRSGRRSGAGRRSSGSRPRSRGLGRPVGAVTATVAVAALLGTAAHLAAAPAWAGFASTTTNPDSTYASAPFYRCSSAVLPQVPTLYHQLDEASGTVAADSSGNGRNGTLQGGYTRTPSGICTTTNQSAVTLNGTTGYLSSAARFTAPNTFTVQTWFKTTTGRGGRIIGFGGSTTGASTTLDRHVYMTNLGQLVFGVQASSTSRPTITSPASYNDGGWHLVTASLSSAGMKLFVDGTLVASRTATTTGTSYTGSWRVGYDDLTTSWASNPTSDYFAGTVAQVAVYPSALSNQAMVDLYQAGRP